MGKILEARYLTVDFVVEADFDLSPVVEALEEKVFFLWNNTGTESSSFGIEPETGDSESPEEDLNELLGVLEQLPDNIQELLSDSRKKVVDIGFECGTLDEAIDSAIPAELVLRIAKLGCSMNIRLYPWVVAPEEYQK